MDYNIILQTEGYQASFELKRFPDYNTSLDLTVVFSVDPRVGKVEARSIPMPIYLRNLYELATYLEQHIADLQKNPQSETYTFVPIDLQFQMQALEGIVIPEEDGEFGLRFMVNMGTPDEESGRVYVGGESTLTVENARRFIATIRQVLADMSYTYDERRWESQPKKALDSELNVNELLQQSFSQIEEVDKLASDMSIELLIIPTVPETLSWKDLRMRLETLSGSSSDKFLGKQPLLRHFQTQAVVEEDEALTPSNHYSFDLAFPNGLALNVWSNKETLPKDLSHFQAQNTLEEYLEQVGQNLVPATIPHLAARWRMIGYYYESTAPAGRSPEESSLLVYLVAALADVCEGYVISKDENVFLKEKYGLGVGVYTAAEFSRAISQKHD